MRIIFLIFFLSFHFVFSQIDINRDYPQYDVILRYSDDFDNDKIKDVLYILSQKETKEDILCPKVNWLFIKVKVMKIL